MSQLSNYGAVGINVEEGKALTDNEQQPGTQEFDLRYLEDSTRNRLEKTVRWLVPLLVSVSIAGGFLYLLIHGFSHLYPDAGGGGEGALDNAHRPSTNSRVGTKTGSTTTTTSSLDEDDFTPPGIDLVPGSAPTGGSFHSGGGGSSSSASAACADHKKCSELGLTGMCCPTMEGVVLGCC